MEGARVDASGFSSGIWCLWKSNFMPTVIVNSSRYCIHLQLNPNSPDVWYLSVIYASPNVGDRQEVWQELRDFNSSYPGPWCIAGDFYSITSNKIVGGSNINFRL